MRLLNLREFLYKKAENLKKSNKALIKPESWGGFIVKPVLIEFWQGKDNRLHDRIVYKKENDKNWKLYNGTYEKNNFNKTC